MPLPPKNYYELRYHQKHWPPLKSHPHDCLRSQSIKKKENITTNDLVQMKRMWYPMTLSAGTDYIIFIVPSPSLFTLTLMVSREAMTTTIWSCSPYYVKNPTYEVNVLQTIMRIITMTLHFPTRDPSIKDIHYWDIKRPLVTRVVFFCVKTWSLPSQKSLVSQKKKKTLSLCSAQMVKIHKRKKEANFYLLNNHWHNSSTNSRKSENSPWFMVIIGFGPSSFKRAFLWVGPVFLFA